MQAVLEGILAEDHVGVARNDAVDDAGLHITDDARDDLGDRDVGGIGSAGDEAALVRAEIEAEEDGLAVSAPAERWRSRGGRGPGRGGVGRLRSGRGGSFGRTHGEVLGVCGLWVQTADPRPLKRPASRAENCGNSRERPRCQSAACRRRSCASMLSRRSAIAGAPAEARAGCVGAGPCTRADGEAGATGPCTVRRATSSLISTARSKSAASSSSHARTSSSSTAAPDPSWASAAGTSHDSSTCAPVSSPSRRRQQAR